MHLGKYQSKNDNRELGKTQVGEKKNGKIKSGNTNRTKNSENIIRNLQVGTNSIRERKSKEYRSDNTQREIYIGK